ncbi:putative nuclear envelope protein [Talaromyces proteolyticus]|uniref:Nuclear envelope protein n=1 Tax=Talaromyces proteolyticus TaxID=1131652 RepID=A0AAD4KUT3_9EURO|nr:putative nuclear envelope protein [Talaromyces proteolyticus]KAH8697221.1 putative nuclear envelope protein [Talaromyces proteolyticus]
MASTLPRPYRRILTSALHRRFVHASALSLLVNYVVAFAIGTKTSLLWSWFPLGACGLRALLLFIATLAVFFVRVAQMHTGPRTTTSPLATFRHIFPVHVAQTFTWYIFSAWWFSEVYMWSAPHDADLGWIKPGGLTERITLNERSIYLHTYHIMLAIMQATLHLYCDYDRLIIPITKHTPESKDKRPHPMDSVTKRLQRGTFKCIAEAFRKALIVTVAGPFIYVIFLRRSAWSFSLFFAKLFWNFPRTAADPPGIMPPDFYNLFVRQIVSGASLVFLWQTANLFFTVFITKEPLKRGQPLTTGTKDPTGSLINGLKAKKDFVKSYAFWELSFISQEYPDRRKAIFGDIDREGGSAWKQVLEACVENINGISSRINHYKNPPSAAGAKAPNVPHPQLQTLPQITEAPKKDNIFAPSPKTSGFSESFGVRAKSYGQSADWTPAARAKVRETLGQASNVILSPERKKQILGTSEPLKLLTGPSTSSQPSFGFSSIPFITQFLRTPIGRPLRQTYAQRLCGIVFGTPTGQISSIADAIESVTQLLMASLVEDTLGQVQGDVTRIIGLFTDTITTLEAFIRDGGLDIHWTDVTFPSSRTPETQAKARLVPDVDIMLSILKTSLAELLGAFEKYHREVGLKSNNIRLARAAAGIVEQVDNDKGNDDDPFVSR